MHRVLSGGAVVNVGAVGLPFNRDRRAQYAIVGFENGSWSVEFRQVAYDIDRVLSIYDSSGFINRGGVTARLLRLELKHAAPFLVPFMMWAEATKRPAELDQLDAFRAFYDPDEPAGRFLSRLHDESGGTPG